MAGIVGQSEVPASITIPFTYFLVFLTSPNKIIQFTLMTDLKVECTDLVPIYFILSKPYKTKKKKNESNRLL